MPTSDADIHMEDAAVNAEAAERAAAQPAASPISRLPFILRAIIVCVVILLVDVGLSYALVPYGSSTDLIFHDFYTAEEGSIDTLIIGPSYAMDVNPLYLDEVLGSDSYSLSVYSQSLDSAVPLIRLAQEKHPLKRVILGLAFETFSTDAYPHSNISIMQTRLAHEPIARYPEILGNYIATEEFFYDAKSIAALFPWAYNHVDLNVQAVSDNLRRRAQYPDPLDAYAETDDGGVYFGQGHFSYDYQADFNTFEAMGAFDDVRWADFLARRIASLERAATYCEAAGIELDVVVVPRPDFQLLARRDNYGSIMGRVRDTVEAHGGTYLDFCLADPAFYHPADAEFSDREHLNFAGQERFSRVLGELLAAKDAGEDISSAFFTTEQVEERIARMEGISLLNLSVEHAATSTIVRAVPYMRDGIRAEYEFYVLPQDGDWQLLRPYSEDPVFELPAEYAANGCTVMVHARQVGSTAAWERHHSAQVAPAS